MAQQFLRVALALAIGAACIDAAWAEGWGLSNLNPFKSKSSSEEIEPEIEETPPPEEAPLPDDSPPKPSPLKRFASGTRSVLTRTGEVLNPFDGKPAKKTPSRTTGSRTAGRSVGKSYPGVRMSRPPEEKTSFFSSLTGWMKPKEEPRQASTVSDFLVQPRPY